MPLFLNSSPTIRSKKGDGIPVSERPVKVTNFNFTHNHSLTKGMLIKAKKGSHQYSISIPVCQKIMEMMDVGPVPTKTLRGFLQKQYPPTVKISSAMVFNVRLKVKRLQMKHYGDHIPGNEIRKVFQDDSLEMSPENWDSDPIFADIYHKAMMEVLNGNTNDDSFPIVDIMEKIKTMQPKGYDYRAFCMEGGERPMGVLHMVPMMIKGTLRYGNIMALDLQGKTKNMYDCGGCFPSGFNNNNKLQNFYDALTLVEDDRW